MARCREFIPAVVTESESEGHEDGQPELDPLPLLIPVVVHELVKFIATDDLRNCRLVCSTWNAQIVSEMRKRSTFSFGHPREVQDFLMNGEKFFGLRNLRLKFGTWTSQSGWKRTLYELLSSQGMSIRRVDFDFQLVPAGVISTLAFRVYLSCMQELECLKLTGLPCSVAHEPLFVAGRPPVILHKLRTITMNLTARRSCHNHEASHIDFYKAMLRLGPSLKELHLSKALRYCNGTTPEGIEALLAASPPDFTGLFLHGHFPRHCAQTLSNSKIFLHKLHFENLEDFSVTFESDTSGNRIRIRKRRTYDSLIPAKHMRSFIIRRLNQCDNGAFGCLQFLHGMYPDP